MTFDLSEPKKVVLQALVLSYNILQLHCRAAIGKSRKGCDRQTDRRQTPSVKQHTKVAAKKNSDKYEYRTRQAECLEVPTFTTELGIRSFKFQAVRIWNNVFKFLKVDIKIGTFKKHLKTFLIKK